jgi:hypothetical protein
MNGGVTMTKNTFRKDEVISFLEMKVLENTATTDETLLYEEYVWNGKLRKNNYTYKKLISQMTNIYNGF